MNRAGNLPTTKSVDPWQLWCRMKSSTKWLTGQKVATIYWLALTNSSMLSPFCRLASGIPSNFIYPHYFPYTTPSMVHILLIIATELYSFLDTIPVQTLSYSKLFFFISQFLQSKVDFFITHFFSRINVNDIKPKKKQFLMIAASASSPQLQFHLRYVFSSIDL